MAFSPKEQRRQDMVTMWSIVTTLSTLTSSKEKGRFLILELKRRPRLMRYFGMVYHNKPIPKELVSHEFDEPELKRMVRRIRNRDLRCGLSAGTVEKVIAIHKLPKPKKHKWWLAIRTYEGSAFCHAWIMKRDGAATSSVLFGQMLVKTADALAAVLGVPVEREVSSLAGPSPASNERS